MVDLLHGSLLGRRESTVPQSVVRRAVFDRQPVRHVSERRTAQSPTVGSADCCARAPSGHATTVLLKRLMNSRRLMGSTPLAENRLRESLIRSSSEGYALHCSRTRELMSALGQKRTFCIALPMSALPPKADIETQSRDVRFVPKAGIWHCSKFGEDSAPCPAQTSSV